MAFESEQANSRERKRHRFHYRLKFTFLGCELIKWDSRFYHCAASRLAHRHYLVMAVQSDLDTDIIRRVIWKSKNSIKTTFLLIIELSSICRCVWDADEHSTFNFQCHVYHLSYCCLLPFRIGCFSDINRQRKKKYFVGGFVCHEMEMNEKWKVFVTAQACEIIQF